MLDAARTYVDSGYNVIPVIGKHPAVRWKRFQTERVTDSQLIRWFATGSYGIAVVCGPISGDLTVLDFDSLDWGRAFYHAAGKALAKCIVLTSRGVHFPFRNPGLPLRNAVGVRVCGVPADIRTAGGFVIWPPSENRRFLEGYGLVEPQSLPEFRAEWIPAPARRASRQFDRDGDMIYRARQYLKRVEPAVQGRAGHNRALYAAGCLVQKFGLSPREAWPLLLEWNERCVPPWDEHQLHDLFRKLEEAERLMKGERHASDD